MQKKNRVTYEGYMELMKKEVAERTGKHVRVEKISKNNGLVLDGLVILSEESNVSPNIYLNGYFEKFLTYGKEAVAEEIIRAYERNRPKALFDISIFTEREKVPHVRVLDLAVVFMAVLKSGFDEGFGTILIHNSHLDFWDMTADDLHELAKENMRNDFEIVSMGEVMKGVFENLADGDLESGVIPGPETDMYVLTAHTKLYGAVGMLHRELLNLFMQENGFEKLVILPSSVHEVLLIPYDDGMEKIDFMEMVKEVNGTELAPEEILSDSVYVYDGNELEILE